MEIGSDITKHYGFLSEYGMLRNHHVDGVFVIPSHGDISVWWGVFFTRGGFYENGAFSFTMYLGEEYPAKECPRIIFKTQVFHPLVDWETRELNVSRGFPTWKENVHHFWQALHFMRRVFVKVEAEQASNEEAAWLFANDPEEFRQRCQMSVTSSRQNLYTDVDEEEEEDADKHAIKFAAINDQEFYDDVRQLIMKDTKCLSFQSETSQVKGYSWIDRDSLMVFADDSL